MKRTERPYRKRRPMLLAMAGLLVMPVAVWVVSEKHYFEVPHEGENRLQAHLDVALGTVEIGKADDGYLFQAEVQIENDKLKPYFDYKRQGRTGILEVDLETGKGDKSFNLGSLSAATSSRWTLLFGDEVPLDLNVELGAAKGNLDFTGLPIERLMLDAGATRASVRFDRPNPVAMEEFVIAAGASQVDLTGLANARARRVKFGGGVGSYKLDFSDGDLPEGARADIEVGMAALTVVVPDDAPVVIYAPDNWLCSVDIPIGFTKKGKGIWFSEGVRDEEKAFHVSVEAGMGKITFALP